MIYRDISPDDDIPPFFPFFSRQACIYNKVSTNIQSPGTHSATKSLSPTKVAAKNVQDTDIHPSFSARWLPAFGPDFSIPRRIANRRFLTCDLNFKDIPRGPRHCTSISSKVVSTAKK
jgi:hypothetical protein